MAHHEIQNDTPFAYTSLFPTDMDGRPLVVPLVKATYKISSNLSSLELNEEQVESEPLGEFCFGNEQSSYKYEPETAFIKSATDIVLIGHAHAQTPNTTEMQAGLSVGPVKKILRVVGDRYLVKKSDVISISEPKPFEKIPLIYERAFGGWDRRDSNPDKFRFEPRNPVGMGYRDSSLDTDDKVALPNIEDPDHPYKSYGDTPPPAGFGFISPHWQPRAALAGTYDKAWDEQRKPLLPKDFDRRFFNAASPGLIAPGYLKGDEPVVVVNASAEGRVAFNLPGVPPPLCNVELRGGKHETLQTQLDTVIINMDENLVFLLWRAYMIVRNGPQDVVAIKVGTESDLAMSVTT